MLRRITAEQLVWLLKFYGQPTAHYSNNAELKMAFFEFIGCPLPRYA